jgi:tetratricopeptide (TPR) repeat protein
VLAVVKGKQGEQTKAEELLWKAIEIFPANVEPYSVLANVYHDRDRAKEIETLEKAVAANPFVYDALHRLTFILVEDRKYDQAIPHLDRMLRLVPADFYANYQLAQIYRTKSESSRSAGALQAAQSECARSGSHLQAARSAVSNTEENRLVADVARRLEQQCGKQQTQ